MMKIKENKNIQDSIFFRIQFFLIMIVIPIVRGNIQQFFFNNYIYNIYDIYYSKKRKNIYYKEK